MALMERVSTLVRANLNDLIDQAEDPDKTLKQVMLDMQNQLMQVKTQVAIAIADQHVLTKKRNEQDEKAADWVRKAELAVSKGEDDLARAALERSLQCRSSSDGYREQVDHQSAQVENLKAALQKLQDKLSEAQSKCDALAAQHRRARAIAKTSDARTEVFTLERVKNKVATAEAVIQATAEMAGASIEDRLASLDKQDQVERLLTEMKARKLTDR